MRLVRYLFSFVLCSLLFVGVFSPSAYATEIVDNIVVRMQLYHNGILYDETPWINNETNHKSQTTINTSSIEYFEEFIYIQGADLAVLVPKGRDMVIEVPAVRSSLQNINNGNEYGPTKFPVAPAFEVTAYDPNGNSYKLDATIQGKMRQNYYYGLYIEAEAVDFDIISFRLKSPKFTIADYWGNASGQYYRNIGFGLAGKITITSEEAGLLKRIISAITDLPNKFFDMLKNFFLPDSDYIVGYKDRWETLLSEHFGAVYECLDLFVVMADIVATDVESSDTITIPVTTVNLVGVDFSFGGYEVKLVPDRFDFLVDILKSFVAVIFTLGFINMLKKKYEEVVTK